MVKESIYHLEELGETFLKMVILCKAVYRFNRITFKTPLAFLKEKEQKVRQICMESQKNPNSQSNPEKVEPWRYHTAWLEM